MCVNMKKIYLIGMLILAILCTSAVSASDNITDSNSNLGIDGNAEMELNNHEDCLLDSANQEVTNESEDDGEVLSANNLGHANSNNAVKKVVTKNVAAYYGDGAKYSVKVFDTSNNPVSNMNVVVKIGNKVLTSKTNNDGIATFNLNYRAGKYTIKYYVDKFSGTNTLLVRNKVTLTTLNWGLKGDVSKVALIKKNMPNNIWVKRAVAATKNGIPLLKIQGGPGKVVFMTAGVHGNELSSQVAAMKMINHLTKTPIKGTVYIIPFVNVKAISHRVRYTDNDFNRIAAKSGTIPNKIVKMIVKFKCNAYGDFHTTQPGGAPGQNIVMGSKSPATKSAALSNYIYKNCKVNKKIYNYAGEVYPGALADNVNRRGIPAVICEVVLPHNTVTSKSVSISYNMMKHLLKFNSVI